MIASDKTRWDHVGIPVFASVPSKLESHQIDSRNFIYRALAGAALQPRTLGSTDVGTFSPLHEVRTLAKHCAGGIILGYAQFGADEAWRLAVESGSRVSRSPVPSYRAPTPWNQLETGVLFGLGLPLLVLKEDGIEGGIFDAGASDVLVHPMPMPKARGAQSFGDTDAGKSFLAVLMRWQAQVRNHYYGLC